MGKWIAKKPESTEEKMISEDGVWELTHLVDRKMYVLGTAAPLSPCIPSGVAATVDAAAHRMIANIDRMIAQLQATRQQAVAQWGEPVREVE